MEKAMAPYSSTLAWKIPWTEGLVGCSPWGRQESDTTERLHFHFSLSCIGEGNGNPLQCSCLENPRDGGASWATIYGVAQSQTWLKRLSSSSSSTDKAAWKTERKSNEYKWTELQQRVGHYEAYMYKIQKGKYTEREREGKNKGKKNISFTFKILNHLQVE